MTVAQQMVIDQVIKESGASKHDNCSFFDGSDLRKWFGWTKHVTGGVMSGMSESGLAFEDGDCWVLSEDVLPN